MSDFRLEATWRVNQDRGTQSVLTSTVCLYSRPLPRVVVFSLHILALPITMTTLWLLLGSCTAFLSPHTTRYRSSNKLYVYSDTSLPDVVFGSANQSSGSTWGMEEDEDDLQAASSHAAQVQALLDQDDQHYRQTTRKNALWGDFANITNAQEFERAKEQLAQRQSLQVAQQQQLAAEYNISFELLEAPDYVDDSVLIKSGSSSSSWFSQMDQELADEWRQLVGNDNTTLLPIPTKSHAQGGIRVGSAGGWSLEIFVGDFVVHRKYGIGRFEGTALRPKTKLSASELQAQQTRRAELLREALRRRGLTTPQEIQAIRSRFGTSDDMDPISNPQTTVLEIQYADALVHVPIDRAYRLSRYRAGDAVIAPKLSRVRGEAWANAKRKVEENTLQLAQDVLALYATRETLQRTPFDPLLEFHVKEFEQTFPYEPTPDQLKCFEDVENDMVWRQRPMDRLVCGDVGFGKTVR